MGHAVGLREHKGVYTHLWSFRVVEGGRKEKRSWPRSPKLLASALFARKYHFSSFALLVRI